MLDSAAPMLRSDLVDTHVDFRSRTLAGVAEQRRRWKRGVDVVGGWLRDVLGRLYVKRHFAPEARARLDQLADNLVAALDRDRGGGMDEPGHAGGGQAEAGRVHAAFKQRADMLVDQCAAYEPLEGLTLNGHMTLGENIGDLSGLIVAYKAYRLSLEGREAPIIVAASTAPTGSSSTCRRSTTPSISPGMGGGWSRSSGNIR